MWPVKSREIRDHRYVVPLRQMYLTYKLYRDMAANNKFLKNSYKDPSEPDDTLYMVNQLDVSDDSTDKVVKYLHQ